MYYNHFQLKIMFYLLSQIRVNADCFDSAVVYVNLKKRKGKTLNFSTPSLSYKRSLKNANTLVKHVNVIWVNYL